MEEEMEEESESEPSEYSSNQKLSNRQRPKDFKDLKNALSNATKKKIN